MNIDELLQETLDERAARVTADDDLAQAVMRRARGRRGRRIFVGLFTLVIVVITVVLTIAQTLSGHRGVVPDPRGTAVPAPTTSAPMPTAATTTGWVTSYRQVDGHVPEPSTATTAEGAPVSFSPRVEARGGTLWFVAPGTVAMLPATATGARTMRRAGPAWVLTTISSGFTGGDTDPGSQLLMVRGSSVTAVHTGAIRSMDVSPDETQVAWVETTTRPWSVSLHVMRLADGSVVRHVTLPYGQEGSWPYPDLTWTSDGIVADNGEQGVGVEGSTVDVVGTQVNDISTASDIGPVAGVHHVPNSKRLVVSTRSGSGLCVYSTLTLLQPGAPMLCGAVRTVEPLSDDLTLVLGEDAPASCVVIDSRQATVTRLDVLQTLQKDGALGGVHPESGTTVLVLVPSGPVWLRWDLVTNTVERATLPPGADAVLG